MIVSESKQASQKVESMNPIQHQKVIANKSPNPNVRKGAYYMNMYDYSIENEPKQ